MTSNCFHFPRTPRKRSISAFTYQFSPSWPLLWKCSCRNSSHVASHFTKYSVIDGCRLSACSCGIALSLEGRCWWKNNLFPNPVISNNAKMPNKVLQQKQRLSWQFFAASFPHSPVEVGDPEPSTVFQMPTMTCPACGLCWVLCWQTSWHPFLILSPSRQCCYSTKWSLTCAATPGCAPGGELRNSPCWTTWCLCWPKSQVSKVHFVSSSVIHVSHTL